jgi:hypothetical protein
MPYLQCWIVGVLGCKLWPAHYLLFPAAVYTLAGTCCVLYFCWTKESNLGTGKYINNLD